MISFAARTVRLQVVGLTLGSSLLVALPTAWASAGDGNSKTSPAPHPASVAGSSLSNGTIDADLSSGGRWTIGATTDPNGEPDGTSYQLTYGWPDDAGTGFVSVRVDGDDTRLTDDAPAATPGTAAVDRPTDGSAYDQRSWYVDGVVVTQTLTLDASGPTASNLRATYRVTSADGLAHTIGIRDMVDVDVNGNDGAIFHVAGQQTPQDEEDLYGSAIPSRMSVYSNLADFTHVGAATFVDAKDDAPDRLTLAYWPSIVGSVYDYTTDPDVSLSPDSAYAVYWDARPLAAGGSFAVSTSYGQSVLNIDVRPPLTIGLDAASSVASTTNPNAPYTPGLVPVLVTVENTSEATAHNVSLHLTTGSGESVVGPASVAVGDIAPHADSEATFELAVHRHLVGTTDSYSVDLSDDDGAKSVVGTLFVPVAPPWPLGYVALGDSFSSGEGAIGDGRHDSSPAECDRYNAAYGPKVAADLHAASFTFAACSGAVTANFDTNPQHPGQALQLSTLRATTGTNLITMSFAGNDVGFADWASYCATAPCDQYETFTNPVTGTSYSGKAQDAMDALVDGAATAGLNRIYNETQQYTSGLATTATVVAVGYPHIFPAHIAVRCGEGFGLYSTGVGTDLTSGVGTVWGWVTQTNSSHPFSTPQRAYSDAELAAFNEVTDRLDGAIATAAKSHGFLFADPRSQFAGHELCGGGADWFIGPVHLSDSSVVAGLHSLHPTEDGQSGYRTAVEQTLAAANITNSNGFEGAVVRAPSTGPLPALVRAPAPPAPAQLRGLAGTRPTLLEPGVATVTPTGSATCAAAVDRAGRAVVVSATGYRPGQPVRIDYGSVNGQTEQGIAWAQAAQDGTVRATVPVPGDAAPSAVSTMTVVGLSPDSHLLVSAGYLAVDPTLACPGKPLPAQAVVVGSIPGLTVATEAPGTGKHAKSRTYHTLASGRAVVVPANARAVTLRTRSGKVVAIVKVNALPGRASLVTISGTAAHPRLKVAALHAGRSFVVNVGTASLRVRGHRLRATVKSLGAYALPTGTKLAFGSQRAITTPLAASTLYLVDAKGKVRHRIALP